MSSKVRETFKWRRGSPSERASIRSSGTRPHAGAFRFSFARLYPELSMSRRVSTSLKALVCSLCVLGAGVSCRRAGEPAARTLHPLNVVVITIDTLRPDHLHCYGYTKLETPTIDRIAHSGVLFENAVT